MIDESDPRGGTREPAPDAYPARGGGRLHRLLDRLRAHPTGRVALKIGIGVLGAAVVAIGIILIPLPGPGWALVLLGLAILAVEFVWAQRVLQFTRRHVRSWTRWVARQSLPLRIAIGTAGLILIGVVCWFAITLGFGVDPIVLGRRLLSGGF